MSSLDDINKIISTNSISSKSLGCGTISKMYLDNENKYRIEVVFDSEERTRTYIARTVFEKETISFVSQEYNQLILDFIDQNEISTEALKTSETPKQSLYSSNCTTNHLIECVLNQILKSFII